MQIILRVLVLFVWSVPYLVFNFPFLGRIDHSREKKCGFFEHPSQRCLQTTPANTRH